MQPLLSWAESKIFGGLHIVLCGWIRFTPRRMMWVMLLCFLLSPSILKNKGNKGKNKEGEEEHCNSHYERLNRKTILQWLFFAGLHPFQISQATFIHLYPIPKQLTAHTSSAKKTRTSWPRGRTNLERWRPGRSKIGCSMLLTFEVEKAQMLRCYQVDSTDARQNPRTHWNHLLLKTPFRTAIYEKWPWNDVFGEHSHLDTRYGQIV